MVSLTVAQVSIVKDEDAFRYNREEYRCFCQEFCRQIEAPYLRDTAAVCCITSSRAEDGVSAEQERFDCFRSIIV